MNDFTGKKLLTIDDEDSLRRSIRIFFEDSGFIVFEAENGREGVRVAVEEQPDIVLVDLRMPEMDGLEVIDVLSKKMPDLPIIVVSGTGVLEDAIEAIRTGACDYITKPVTDLLALEHTVGKALENAALIVENRMYQEHLEELVEKRTAELRHAQKMEAMGTLAGGIAHDFNNILTGIIGYNELALMSCTNDKNREYLLESQKAANRAKELVQQILTFSRKKEHEKYPVQVSLILKEALKLLRSSIPSSIEINHEIVSGAKALADPSQVHQIIMNLCTNSFHAMEDKGGILDISLKEKDLHAGDLSAESPLTPGKYLILRVADTGEGMRREVMQRVFEPYYTTKATGRGTGLGLAVVHGIVGSYDGDVTVESEVGKGTVFQVFLPVVEGQPTVIPAATPVDIPITGSERILFIDDEKEILDIAEQAFSQFGYHIDTFADPVRAVEEFRKNPNQYDLVITDMTMPGITGDEVISLVLGLRPDIPVFLCSGYAETIIREKVSLAGVRKVINKPLVLKELLNTVRRELDGWNKNE
jgi:signal transduction histidine kinase